MFTDSHCHLQFRAYNNDRDEVIKRCQEKGVMLNVVGTQKDTSKTAVEMAEKHDFIYATIGLHPIHVSSTEVDEEEIHFTSREENLDEEFYDKLAKSNKVIATGETGLDLYHIPSGMSKAEVLTKQKAVFLKHVEFASRNSLPLVIHVRDAHQEMIEVLSQLSKEINGVVHCYTSNWRYARQYLDIGLYLGFTGVITFFPQKTNPQAQYDLIEVVKNCPLDKMLIETDAPYLAPQAYRGQRCEPWMVEEVAKKVAEIKQVRLDEVVEQTSRNFQTLFNKVV